MALALLADDQEAAEARDDFERFFEFVMRAEDTGEPIRIAPHQRVMNDFLRAHSKVCLLGAYDISKTFLVAAEILFDLGHNPSLRFALVGASEEQPKKVLKTIRTLIEHSLELRLVFPDLAPTRRPGEPWTDTDITVDRPLGIRDASVCARGIESDRIPGSRWDRLIIDDLVNDENTRTPERRDWMHSLVQKRAISRVDARKGKVWWLSNAWHPDDSFQRHTKVWPTITLRIDGTILLRNAPDWDSDLIRPADDRDASDPDAEYRLVAHDAPEPDNDNAIPLWPERQPAEWIAEKRRELLPEAFAQGYLCICRDYSQSLCRPEYIAKCRAVATLLQLTTMFYRRSDCALPGLVFVGIDLAFSKQASADESAFFAVLVTPDRTCVPLGIEHGRWSADEIEQRFLDFYDRYQPAGIAVENIAAQEFVRQTLQRLDKHAPVKPHTTDKTKHNVFFGVPAIFAAFAAGAWAFPHRQGRLPEALQKFTDQCLGYVPSDHTGDILMAAYFAVELARKYGALARARDPKARPAANVMVR